MRPCTAVNAVAHSPHPLRTAAGRMRAATSVNAHDRRTGIQGVVFRRKEKPACQRVLPFLDVSRPERFQKRNSGVCLMQAVADILPLTSVSEPLEEFMAIRNEDWDAIHRTINQSIETAVSKLQPRGWRKAIHVLREWGVLGTIGTIMVALLAMSAAAWYQAFARLEKETVFQTKTGSKLETIEIDLKEIHASLDRQSLTTHAALGLEDFKATLPDLNSVVASARKQKLNLSAKVIDDLSSKLGQTAKADANAPALWPTIATFISYRSIVFSQNVGTDLPNCTDHDPTPMHVIDEPRKTKGNKFQFHLTTSEYSNCKLTLDSPKDDARINFLVTHSAPFLTFKNCLIIYRGGPIGLIVGLKNVSYNAQIGIHPIRPALSGNTLHFENCVLDFSFDSVPPIEGQRVTQLLLSQSPTSADLPVESTLS